MAKLSSVMLMLCVVSLMISCQKEKLAPPVEVKLEAKDDSPAIFTESPVEYLIRTLQAHPTGIEVDMRYIGPRHVNRNTHRNENKFAKTQQMVGRQTSHEHALRQILKDMIAKFNSGNRNRNVKLKLDPRNNRRLTIWYKHNRTVGHLKNNLNRSTNVIKFVVEDPSFVPGGRIFRIKKVVNALPGEFPPY